MKNPPSSGFRAIVSGALVADVLAWQQYSISALGSELAATRDAGSDKPASGEPASPRQFFEKPLRIASVVAPTPAGNLEQRLAALEKFREPRRRRRGSFDGFGRPAGDTGEAYGMAADFSGCQPGANERLAALRMLRRNRG